MSTVDDTVRRWWEQAWATWNRQRPHLVAGWHIFSAWWRALWLRKHPLRALAEGLLAQTLALLWSIQILLTQQNGGTPNLRSDYLGPMFLIAFISGVASLLWAAFRMRLARVWWHGALINLISAIILAIIPTIFLDIFLGVIRAVGIPPTRDLLSVGTRYSLLITRFTLLWLVVLTCAFFFVRVGIVLLIRWDHLRKRSLVWSLTHAHLMVVVLGAVVLSLFVVLVEIYSTNSIEPQILPILVFFSLLTVVAVLVVLPPSALFSYVFARRTTRRLRELTAATDTLRAGDYDAQVRVQGEDEVAQLQANFNAMATDLKSAVRDVEAERDTISHLLQARRELVASVSHELRTPVSTLRGYLESSIANWREGEAAPPLLRHDLEIMERETRQLQTLIEDLFTLARAEVGRLEMCCVPVAVGAEVQRIIETVKPLAWQSGRVEVVAEVAPQLPPALVDAQRLRQVLQNLLHNGIRHTPPGGIVALSAAADEQHVTLQVKDTGEGIAPDDLPHIWERFYRSERARMQSAAGSGLGLALVKELTEAMGGSVAVESVLGQGSCFTITVPRAAKIPTPRPARNTPTPAITMPRPSGAPSV